MAETYRHQITVRLHGSKVISEGGQVELDRELQEGELYEWESHPMQVDQAWSEDREYGRIRVVVLEGPIG